MTLESPLDVAKRLSGRRDAEKIFGKTALLITVDKRIDNVAHRLLTLITACSWSRPFQASFAELADAIPDCCERTAIRKCRVLEKLGYVEIRRHRNSRNEYWTTLTRHKEAPARMPRGRPVELRPCGRCKTDCVPQRRTGWCRQCSQEARQLNITKGMVREEVVNELDRRKAKR